MYLYFLTHTVCVQDASKDCADVMAKGNFDSGVFAVTIGTRDANVYCDMTTDGGGWTVRTLSLTKYNKMYRECPK